MATRCTVIGVGGACLRAVVRRRRRRLSTERYSLQAASRLAVGTGDWGARNGQAETESWWMRLRRWADSPHAGSGALIPGPVPFSAV